MAKLIFAFREQYDREIAYLHRALRPGMVFVDVGASIGVYSLMASRRVGSGGLVMAFEPSVSSFAALGHNLEMNSTTNVKAFPLGLAQGACTRMLYHFPDPSRNSFGAEGSEPLSCEEVVTTSLDEILSSEGVSHVNFVKIDVEGAEELVLKGARATLSRFRPVIIFEVNSEASRSLRLTALGAWDLLKAEGYAFFRSDTEGHLSPLPTPPSGGNVVARPL